MNVYNPSPVVEPANLSGAGSQTGLASTLAGQLDLRRLYTAFRRRLKLFAAVAATVLILAILLTLQATPKYTATANVMLDPRKERVTNVEEVLSGLPADSSVVDTEVEVLKSRQLAERVVAALHLQDDPEFNSALRKPSGIGAVVGGFTGLFKKAAPSNAQLTPVQAQKRRERIVDAVLANLSVKRTGLTYIINVGFESEHPEKAANIANKFAELYLLEQMEAKFEATQQATRWLNSRLDELRGQVLADEAAVQQFKIANNLLSASGTNLTEQEISNYNQTLAQARAQVAEDEARLSAAKAQLARGSTGEDVGEALSSPVVQKLREQRT